MAITMSLGGVDLGSNFPLFSRSFEPVRVSEQGGSIKKINITLAGFVQGDNGDAVITVCDIIAAVAELNDTTFTYIHNGATRYSSKKVYIGGYSEPQDAEHARERVGDYSINLYYYEDSADSVGIACSYGAYTFEKAPKWGRKITPNRESPLSTAGESPEGSTATITISGVIFKDNHSALVDEIELITAAFSADNLLTYGDFAHNVKVQDFDIAEDVKSQFAYYSATLVYYTTSVIELRRKISFSRVHNNTIITEQPFCNTRLIQNMNVSGQFVTYRVSLRSNDITTAKGLIATELAYVIEPGGLEMQGGEESWDLDNGRVDISVVKFYNTAILANTP